MADETLEQALERATAAVKRIETALERAPRDEKLRAEVRQALAQLDAMISEAS